MKTNFARAIPALLILACLLPFVPGLGGPFLHDDAINLASLKVGPFSLQSAFDAAFRNESGMLRRPLSNLSLAANLWLHGQTPFGFKVFNLLLHGACGLALFGLLRAVLAGLCPAMAPQRRNAIALLAAMLWTVHPLQVSTVLYVVQRMAQWPTLFLFLLCWRFQTYLNRGDFSRRSNLSMLIAWICLLTLALASKENGALAPLLMGVQYLLTNGTSQPARPPRWLSLLMIGLPLLAGALIAAAVPELVLAGYAGRDFTPGQRLMTESIVLWHYLRLWFIPWIPWMGLYADMPVRGTGDPFAWLAIFGWLTATVGTLLLRRRRPLLAFAVLWYLAAHAMESTLFPLELMYEHRNYLALPGMALLVAAGAEALSRRLEVRLALLATPLLLLLAGTTLHRAHTWSSPEAFAFSEHVHHPDSNRATMMVLSRSVAIGDAKTTGSLLATLKAKNPGALWPTALDAAMQCTAPRFPVDWARLKSGILRMGSENRVVQLLRQVAINRISGHCPYLEEKQFLEVILAGYNRAMADGYSQQVELYGIYMAWLMSSKGELDAAAAWFRRTSIAAPSSVEPLFDLAYMELNRGRLPSVAAAIAELRIRQAASPSIRYRIDELERQFALARNEASP